MGWFEEKAPQRVHVGEIELRCQICRHDEFRQREAQLNTAVASFFDLDWANRTASCYVCDHCGYVHWFLHER